MKATLPYSARIPGPNEPQSVIVVAADGRSILQVWDYSDRPKWSAADTAKYIERACNDLPSLIGALQDLVAYAPKPITKGMYSNALEMAITILANQSQ